LAHLLLGDCQFLVNMKCAFQDRENLYLLMDYLDGGDLRSYINCHYTFNEEQISQPSLI
jgi:serine/threonine protein kinase